jgi:hypothetical protein
MELNETCDPGLESWMGRPGNLWNTPQGRRCEGRDRLRGKQFLDYPDHSAANQQKTLAASGIPAIASPPPILRVHAEPAG